MIVFCIVWIGFFYGLYVCFVKFFVQVVKDLGVVVMIVKDFGKFVNVVSIFGVIVFVIEYGDYVILIVEGEGVEGVFDMFIELFIIDYDQDFV